MAALAAVRRAQAQVRCRSTRADRARIAAADGRRRVGDSAISGEAGRWAGNTNQASSKTDALGSERLQRRRHAESTPGCHRSKSAEVHIGDGVESINLACSGARTYSRISDGKFKPGIDFYNSGGATRARRCALQEIATTNKNIKAVVVLIGANDYGFADIVETCVLNWLTSPSWWKNYCQDDSNMVQMFSAVEPAPRSPTDVRDGVQPTSSRRWPTPATPTSQYEILAQTYSAPLPTSSGIRYPETGFTRQTIGGCGVWNADANWARNTAVDAMNNSVRNATAGMSNVKLLDMVGALYGRRLCENTVGLLEEKGVSTWQSAGAVDKTEWVHQIRTITTIFPPYQLQEDGHPNYWGQLALRNCFRQAVTTAARSPRRHTARAAPASTPRASRTWR